MKPTIWNEYVELEPHDVIQAGDLWARKQNVETDSPFHRHPRVLMNPWKRVMGSVGSKFVDWGGGDVYHLIRLRTFARKPVRIPMNPIYSKPLPLP